MDFKYIHQPEYAIEFRVFDNVSGEIFPAIGFDDESVYAVLDGEIESLDRTDCEIDQWIGLLDQDERKIFTSDIVEVRNTYGRPVGLFIVRYNNREGRYILDGVTRGAHISRITQYQNMRVVGNA
ncbi:MAG: YopX family protein, partial [Eubacteriales bacterium]|nr:YopX family protein [Eubacteriales bacterium]